MPRPAKRFASPPTKCRARPIRSNHPPPFPARPFRPKRFELSQPDFHPPGESLRRSLADSPHPGKALQFLAVPRPGRGIFRLRWKRFAGKACWERSFPLRVPQTEALRAGKTANNEALPLGRKDRAGGFISSDRSASPWGGKTGGEFTISDPSASGQKAASTAASPFRFSEALPLLS